LNFDLVFETYFFPKGWAMAEFDGKLLIAHPLESEQTHQYWVALQWLTGMDGIPLGISLAKAAWAKSKGGLGFGEGCGLVFLWILVVEFGALTPAVNTIVLPSTITTLQY
jgi:hypothetical protein